MTANNTPENRASARLSDYSFLDNNADFADLHDVLMRKIAQISGIINSLSGNDQFDCIRKTDTANALWAADDIVDEIHAIGMRLDDLHEREMSRAHTAGADELRDLQFKVMEQRVHEMTGHGNQQPTPPVPAPSPFTRQKRCAKLLSAAIKMSQPDAPMNAVLCAVEHELAMLGESLEVSS